MSKKDAEEFTRIIKENQGLIFKISTFYCNCNQSDQEDLYQEIVLQLWRSFLTFRKESQIGTWIYRVSINTAVTQFRKAKKHVERTPITKVVMNYTDAVDANFEEKVKSLYEQIEQLNDLEKALIFLFLENKSYEEIAQISGLTVTNVATRLSRIKHKLKSQLKPTKV